MYTTTGPCDEISCSLQCTTTAGVCLQLNGNFIDGTPCAGGGACRGGQCTGSSILGLLSYYFQSQPQLAYPVAIGLALLLLSIIWCCVSRCVQSVREKRKVELPQSRVGDTRVNYSGWVDPTAYNGHVETRVLNSN